MDSAEDTEITLGTAKLLGLFFGLVIVCAVFFALGYTLGRKSDTGLTASAAALLPTPSNGAKPASSESAQTAPSMTFYKAVEQKDATAQLTPASTSAGPTTPAAAGQASATPPVASSSGASAAEAPAQPPQISNPPDPAALPISAYFVQVAAVSKQGDAEALVDALKSKQYPAFVAENSAADKLFRVQVGPFADVKDAEAMRSRLINDGYNPILKK
ncbi:MAG: SPOR domain-containing protein [Candidatus Sulfotelmatobacter sp.]